jgi:hypothetical protein
VGLEIATDLRFKVSPNDLPLRLVRGVRRGQGVSFILVHTNH